MARKPRDYRAEYKRRLERNKHLDKSVRRGHPKKGYLGIKKAAALGVSVDQRENLRDLERRYSDEQLYLNMRQAGFKRHFVTDLRVHLEKVLPDEIHDLRAQTYNERQWVRIATASGLTEREAYTLWFSP